MTSENNNSSQRPSPSRRVISIPTSATKQMGLLAGQVKDVVSLGQGVPSFDPPPHLIDALSRAVRENPSSSRYTLQPGLPELRTAIARFLENKKRVLLDPATEIGVTVGAMEALLASVMAVTDPGDEVILPSPTYASYIEQIMLAGGTPVFAPLNTADWSLDLAAIERAVTPKTRAVMLCNPGNPTGAVFSDDDVRALAGLALKHNLVIISDETYDALVFDGPPPLSPLSLPEVRDRVIVVSSFSKKYAVTGWRIGWAAASAEWMEQLMKVHDAAAICAPVPSQYAALAALTGPQKCVEEMRQALARRRDLCCQRLDSLAEYFDYVRPSGAFYVMARYKFTEAPSSEVARRVLREAGVVTIPGQSYGPGGDGRLRLSFGGREDVINEAFNRLEAWLKNI